MNGGITSHHTSEIAFVFHNLTEPQLRLATGDGPQGYVLQDKVSTAWLNFAKTRNPSQPGLEWKTFMPTDRQHSGRPPILTPLSERSALLNSGPAIAGLLAPKRRRQHRLRSRSGGWRTAASTRAGVALGLSGKMQMLFALGEGVSVEGAKE